MEDLLKQIRISAGIGENRFTMKRGSFNYRQKISRRVNFRLKEIRENGSGYDAVFRWYKDEIILAVERDGGYYMAHVRVDSRHPLNRFKFTFPTDPDIHFYGGGEVHSTFDLKGERIRIFVAEHQNAKRIGKKMIRKGLTAGRSDVVYPLHKYESYYVQPTFVTSEKWFFHAETSSYCEMDFTVPGEATFRTQEPPVIWMGYAESFEQLSEQLTSILGRQRNLPDWVYDGAILAVQEGSEAVDRKIRTALDAGAKVCGVWCQDWCGCRRTGFGYQVMWNWEWDRDLYINPEAKVREWKEKGVRFLGYINPFLAIEKGLYEYAAAHGYCVKDKEGKDYLVTITTFPAAMIDFTNPEAYDWYKSIIKKNMIGSGMGGWMADFGEYLPTDCVLYSGEDPEVLHNRWPAIWARLNSEAIAEAGAQDEVFFFTRAGSTETHKYSPMMWTGDQHVDWSTDDGIASVIPATLSLAMSGYGMTHSDVGGYTTVMRMTRSRELLLRWEEMNAFSPLYRFHEGNQPSRNVQFDADEELLAQLARFSGIHASLKPYLKSLEAQNSEKGTPVMRPLFYHYDEERAYTVRDEYLLGRDMLVAPVLKKGAASRKVWLPEDEWVHYFTGKEYKGGEFRVSAPVGMPPVFVRKNSKLLSEEQK